MILHQHRRPGLTLTESLVALFIMAFGVLSLMTLFPLGAIRMGQSLRDDRLAQCAWQADGITRTWWQVEVVEKNAGSEATFWKTLDTGTGASAAIAADSTAPSYVVAVDPIGYATRGPGNMGVSGPGTSQIPRRTSDQLLTLTASNATLGFSAAVRLCSLVDDVSFNKTGTPRYAREQRHPSGELQLDGHDATAK